MGFMVRWLLKNLRAYFDFPKVYKVYFHFQFMFKRGINAVIAVVIMILIVVVGITIVWTGIIQLVDFSDIEYDEVSLDVVNEGGYTYFDDEKDIACLQIKRGADDKQLDKIKVIFIKDGNSYGAEITEGLPGPNEKVKKCFKTSAIGEPDSVKLVPVFLEGLKEIYGIESQEVKKFLDGLWEGIEDELVEDEDLYECVPDCSGRECGDDGCGGLCGVCNWPYSVCLGDDCINLGSQIFIDALISGKNKNMFSLYNYALDDLSYGDKSVIKEYYKGKFVRFFPSIEEGPVIDKCFEIIEVGFEDDSWDGGVVFKTDENFYLEVDEDSCEYPGGVFNDCYDFVSGPAEDYQVHFYASIESCELSLNFFPECYDDEDCDGACDCLGEECEFSIGPSAYEEVCIFGDCVCT